MFIFKSIKPFLITLGLAFLLSSCGSLPKFDFSKPAIEPNAQKRAQQNAKDGKGIQVFKSRKNSGDFLFASSNPMWKAALDTLSFISLANADYSGGVLITDWYSENNPDEAIKINIRFLSNQIRADGLIVNIYKRTCVNNKCTTKEIKSNLIFEIKDKILKTAAIYNTQDDLNDKQQQPGKVYRGDNE
tara:strand:- start:240 stop:803 length:564 start_codon:yes stop_codon:yes gene_type:complete